MIKINSNGDSGQPWRKPLPLWKKGEGSPFTRTEKVAVVTQPMIQLIESSLNLIAPESTEESPSRCSQMPFLDLV
jgi:hypothetical protein